MSVAFFHLYKPLRQCLDFNNCQLFENSFILLIVTSTISLCLLVSIYKSLGTSSLITIVKMCNIQ